MASRIHEALQINSLPELLAAAYDGRLAQVLGFGAGRLRAVRESLAGRSRLTAQGAKRAAVSKTVIPPPVNNHQSANCSTLIATGTTSACASALVVAALGYGLVTWSMVANTCFATVSRIQDDRQQRVVTGGSYRYIRHPGYIGSILFELATPLALGSLWALLPGLIGALLMVLHTALEDRMLQEALDGYRAFAQAARSCLIPRSGNGGSLAQNPGWLSSFTSIYLASPERHFY